MWSLTDIVKLVSTKVELINERLDRIESLLEEIIKKQNSEK
jgi:hypothetical protein